MHRLSRTAWTVAVFPLVVSVGVVQQPTVTLRALTPLSATARVGVQTQSSAVSIGTLAPSGSCSATVGTSVVGNAQSHTQWTYVAGPTLVACTLLQSLVVANTSVGESTAGPHELLLEIASPVVRPVTATIEIVKGATPGLPATTVELDLDNDGVVELSGAVLSGTFHRTGTVGPQPWQIRVRFVGAIPLGAIGSLLDVVRITVRPENNLQILPALAGCLDNGVFAVPAWDASGVALTPLTIVPPPVPPLRIAVAGLTAQPSFLPPVGGPFPCLLLPSPDLVVVPTTNDFELALPPAVRPVTVFLQYVVLMPNGMLGTSNAYAVHAAP
jgi:hypothetical protein